MFFSFIFEIRSNANQLKGNRSLFNKQHVFFQTAEEAEQPEVSNAVYLVGTQLVRGASAFIALIGCAGNVITYLSARKLGNSSGSVFMRCLALADSLLLLVHGLLLSAFPLFSLDLLHLSEIFCKTLSSFFTFAGPLCKSCIFSVVPEQMFSIN